MGGGTAGGRVGQRSRHSSRAAAWHGAEGHLSCHPSSRKRTRTLLSEMAGREVSRECDCSPVRPSRLHRRPSVAATRGGRGGADEVVPTSCCCGACIGTKGGRAARGFSSSEAPALQGRRRRSTSADPRSAATIAAGGLLGRVTRLQWAAGRAVCRAYPLGCVPPKAAGLSPAQITHHTD